MDQENLEKVKELEKENQLLRCILDHINEGVSAVDKEGCYILYNRGTEICEGMSRDEVLGRHDLDIYPHCSENNFYEDVIKKVVETKQPLLEKLCKYYLPNGRMCEILISSYPFFYKGKLVAVFNIGRNIRQANPFIARMMELQTQYCREDNNNNEVFSIGPKYTFDNIIGQSHSLKKTIFQARKIACRDSHVLVFGETGTGKELFVQGIHNASLYAKGPFITVNCAAIPETLLESLIFGTSKGAFTGAVEKPGLFEQADGGTLFLDEINSMPISLQAKLLRVLQDQVIRRIGGKEEKPVHCRIISAMNVEPRIALKEQQIREDLFFRLAAVILHVPPLKERNEDINILVDHFIEKYNDQFGLYVKGCSDKLINVFKEYHWPGNVRELENVIESAMNFIEESESIIGLKHLPVYIREKFFKYRKNHLPSVSKAGKLDDILYEVEKRIIEEALQKNSLNISKTAQELGILRQSLNYKMKKFRLKDR